MAIWLKRGAAAEEKAVADRKVRDIVEAALGDIEKRGDEAVREMSIKFDGWDREDYRLSQSEIDAAVDSLSPQERKDIEFAQYIGLRRIERTFVFLLQILPENVLCFLLWRKAIYCGKVHQWHICYLWK